MRVCVVTQDGAVAALLREGIKEAKIEILSSGADIIDCLIKPNQEPPLVFIDITTTADGLRALDFIKSSSVIGQIPIILIAHTGQAEHVGAQADAVLFFPFTPAEVETLANRLKQHRRW